MMSRLAIVGVGAIGGSVATDLADLKRHELLLCTRTPFESLVIPGAWWKRISNAALGGVCALAQRENAIARDPAVRELVIRLMREVVLLGRAEGASLPDDAPEKVLDRVLEAAADHWSSISVDRREGRAMEWEVRNAVVGRLGRIHGVATPWNDAITAMLRAASGGSAGTDAATQSNARRPAPSAADTG